MGDRDAEASRRTAARIAARFDGLHERTSGIELGTAVTAFEALLTIARLGGHIEQKRAPGAELSALVAACARGGASAEPGNAPVPAPPGLVLRIGRRRLAEAGCAAAACRTRTSRLACRS